MHKLDKTETLVTMGDMTYTETLVTMGDMTYTETLVTMGEMTYVREVTETVFYNCTCLECQSEYFLSWFELVSLK